MEEIHIANDDDDDQQSPVNDKSSSDKTFSVSSESSMAVGEIKQQPIPTKSNARICRVKVDNHNSIPNLTIKHPDQSNDNNNFDLLNDNKKFITDKKHVKVFHINRSTLPDVTTDISFLKFNISAKRKTTGTINVSHINNKQSENINGKKNNHEIKQTKSGQNPIRNNHMITGVTMNQKRVSSKPLVTQISSNVVNDTSEKLTRKQKLHVTVKRVSVNDD